MTDLNKKEKIIGIICYVFYSAVLTYQRRFLFSLVYFAAVALVIFFADKIIKNDVIKSKTVTVFLITAISYQTMFEIFYSAHGYLEQLGTAAAVAIFFACIFALTDKNKLPYCIIAAPVLCFLSLKIAICYCVLLLCLSIVKLQLKEKEPKKKKNSKKSLSPQKLYVISTVTSIVCFGVCVYLMLNLEGYIKEDFNYLLVKFKNPIALILVAVYLSVKIFKSNFLPKASIGISLAVFTIITVFTTMILGWSVFALFCLCVPAFLSLFCLKNVDITESVKADYEKNKYLFWVLIVCLLQ